MAVKHKKRSVLRSLLNDARSSKILILASSSFTAWRLRWPWILLSILFDFLFLLGVGMTVTLVQFTLLEHLKQLMTMMGTATGGLINIYEDSVGVSSALSTLSADSTFHYHLMIIIKYLAILVGIIFVLWIIFQGLNWYIAYRMTAKKRLGFWSYMKNFTLQSIPFYLLTVFWIFLSIRMLFSIRMSITPIMSKELLDFLFVLLVVITWYFGTISYTLTYRSAWKNIVSTFKYGAKCFGKLIQSFAVIFLLFIIVDRILRLPFFQGDPVLLLIGGMILFMPVLVYARILLFRTRKEYWE